MAEVQLENLTERYAFCDPASAKKERELHKIRARSAIVVVAADPYDHIFVLEAWAQRTSTDKLIEKMYDVHERWKLRVLGGEANGMQSIFQDAVIRDARLRGKQLPLHKVEVPTRIDKDTRIRNILQPIIGNGRLFVSDDMTELKTEIAGFPLTPYKDLIDALASAIRLIPPRTTRPERDHETDELLAYLRNSGAPASYVEEQARKRGRFARRD